MPTATTTPDICASAMNLRFLIGEALVELETLPPHPQRTRLGRHLLTAHTIATAWHEDGDMDTSKGVHPGA